MAIVSIKIPEELAELLGKTPEDRLRVVLEGAAIEGYRIGRLSKADGAEMLGLTEDYFAVMLKARKGAERGMWLPDKNGNLRWEGPPLPRQVRGRAIINFISDRPHSIENCLMEDGSRGNVVRRADLGNPSWRHQLRDGSYIYGDVQIADEDVYFKKSGFMPKREIPDDEVPNLERDILLSYRMQEFVKDRKFAVKLHEALCNNHWQSMKVPNCIWCYSPRDAGAIVASVRNKGEEYIDFFGSYLEGHIDPIIRREFLILHWEEASSEKGD